MFDDAKGFGFITQDTGGSELFVHYSAITMSGRRSLEAGQRVRFEIQDTPKGPRAVDVVPVATLTTEVRPDSVLADKRVPIADAYVVLRPDTPHTTNEEARDG